MLSILYEESSYARNKHRYGQQSTTSINVETHREEVCCVSRCAHKGTAVLLIFFGEPRRPDEAGYEREGCFFSSLCQKAFHVA